MVRALVIASLLAACSSGSRGPAWPKASAKTADGGESLAPRQVSPLAIKDVPDDVVAIDPITEKPIVRPATPDGPTETPTRPTPTTITSPDVIINVDDIVIDLDD